MIPWGLVLPPWAKLAALAALLLAVWACGYGSGRAAVRAAWDAANAKAEAAHVADVVRLAKQASEIELVWVNTTTKIHERAATLTREVTKYVSAKADRECTVPAGFVRLWNDAVPASLYAPAAAGSDDAAAGLALSAVARDGVIEAQRRFALNRAALVACQAWARTLAAPVK